ncbi:MAG: hypothetical protein EHM78_25280 [Myxococcaceae bacterium]|nr:MAG: hypothetical protein EHM78_25280 [Myxococcaceae bacterium]
MVQYWNGPVDFSVVPIMIQLTQTFPLGAKLGAKSDAAAADARMALLLIDHARRERLKLLGRARVLDACEHPDLADRLAPAPAPRKRVERLVKIEVVAFDWNCPAWITPRYTSAESRRWSTRSGSGSQSSSPAAEHVPRRRTLRRSRRRAPTVASSGACSLLLGL